MSKVICTKAVVLTKICKGHITSWFYTTCTEVCTQHCYTSSQWHNQKYTGQNTVQHDDIHLPHPTLLKHYDSCFHKLQMYIIDSNIQPPPQHY